MRWRLCELHVPQAEFPWRVKAGTLDLTYLRATSAALGVADLLDRALGAAGLAPG